MSTDKISTPIGDLFLAASERGLTEISFSARRASPPVAGATVFLTQAEEELRAYFAGELRTFTTPLDLALPPFQQAVLAALGRVPYGETATYGGLAAAIGKPQASRAVGNALNTNPVAIILPCHRVLPASGKLGGYAGGAAAKQYLLGLESA